MRTPEEYTGELFGDNRGLRPVIQNEECESIMKEDAVKVITELKPRKSAGSEDTTTEMLTALDENGVTLVHELCTQIVISGMIPKDTNESVFVASQNNQKLNSVQKPCIGAAF